MKAFLSHSSRDKPLVEEVAKRLGFASCEYDAYTFEFTLNAQAIRRALARCDLFVLFLSEHSVRSNFVADEIRSAHDLRAQGSLKKVLIFTLDTASFRQLPEWMQSVNVVQRATSPQVCARKIGAELFAIEAEREKANRDLHSEGRRSSKTSSRAP